MVAGHNPVRETERKRKKEREITKMGWISRHTAKNGEEGRKKVEGRERKEEEKEGTLLFPNSFEFSISRGEGWRVVVGSGRCGLLDGRLALVTGVSQKTRLLRVEEGQGRADEGMCGKGLVGRHHRHSVRHTAFSGGRSNGTEGCWSLRVTTASIHGVGKRGCACADPIHILASILLADRTVSQIIGVLPNVSLVVRLVARTIDLSAASESGR